MITLECPHCQSCFTAEDWNKSAHRGDDIPEDINEYIDFDDWNLRTGGSIMDCPECKDVALTQDMLVV